MSRSGDPEVLLEIFPDSLLAVKTGLEKLLAVLIILAAAAAFASSAAKWWHFDQQANTGVMGLALHADQSARQPGAPAARTSISESTGA